MRAEPDLITDVHPQVNEIEEQVKTVREVVSSEKELSDRFAPYGHSRFVTGYPELRSRILALIVNFLLDCFTETLSKIRPLNKLKRKTNPCSGP